MVTKVRIYIEGGSPDTSDKFRMGFHQFFKPIVDAARARKVGFDFVVRGARDKAFDRFQDQARKDTDKGTVHFLLVDSEGPVAKPPWEHLRHRGDKWDRTGLLDEQCLLMVQMMEHWFLSDRNALKEVFGQRLAENKLPDLNANLEGLSKSEVATALRDATGGMTKHAYHKTKHAPLILMKLDPVVVQAKMSHCRRAFDLLQRAVTSQPPFASETKTQ